MTNRSYIGGDVVKEIYLLLVIITILKCVSFYKEPQMAYSY